VQAVGLALLLASAGAWIGFFVHSSNVLVWYRPEDPSQAVRIRWQRPDPDRFWTFAAALRRAIEATQGLPRTNLFGLPHIDDGVARGGPGSGDVLGDLTGRPLVRLAYRAGTFTHAEFQFTPVTLRATYRMVWSSGSMECPLSSIDPAWIDHWALRLPSPLGVLWFVSASLVCSYGAFAEGHPMGPPVIWGLLLIVLAGALARAVRAAVSSRGGVRGFHRRPDGRLVALVRADRPDRERSWLFALALQEAIRAATGEEQVPVEGGPELVAKVAPFRSCRVQVVGDEVRWQTQGFTGGQSLSIPLASLRPGFVRRRERAIGWLIAALLLALLAAAFWVCPLLRGAFPEVWWPLLVVSAPFALGAASCWLMHVRRACDVAEFSYRGAATVAFAVPWNGPDPRAFQEFLEDLRGKIEVAAPQAEQP
jgi:hypothetical protein